MTTALELANLFIKAHGYDLILNNVRLNTLVYWAQVESFRIWQKPVFTDHVEAWLMGPVALEVFQAFKGYGKRRLVLPRGEIASDQLSLSLVADVMDKYGFLTTYDLVCFTQRPGSAWQLAYQQGAESQITEDLILASTDGVVQPKSQGSLAAAIEQVNRTWPNTFRILKNA
ncbi:Panacea domain-containing protein [Bombiscardovia coagulans]|uniref:Antitoxin SocA-like Panacea domain-containing protein n=1 Tax=Bombiscardovia coagulans TaxID=686666 RepID=A0A261ETT0_9BIFI|nr:type II toxin-antitoxin system antitoxin SocA domain-containing protein [Bombiscardovia coagulans]OZG50263.1 hypothetical protein BOCO_0780 [Bombiscardovia coagulans]